MVEQVRRWLGGANTKQKQYLANLFTISAGAITVPIWQSIYTNGLKSLNLELTFINLTLIAISALLLKFGYDCLGDNG